MQPKPLHIGGEVEIQIGPLTYSSAVLFSNGCAAMASDP
jgi:hypothetical protein